MSLHAQLSPEAVERLHAQQRRSSISSILIAVLCLIFGGILLGLFMLPALLPSADAPDSITVVADEPDPPETTSKGFTGGDSLANARHMRPIPVNHPQMPMIPPHRESPPIPDFNTTGASTGYDIPNPNEPFGDPFPDGIKSDTIIPPAVMGARCSAEQRLKRLTEAGGSPRAERAVIKALDYLKKTQNADGSWDSQYRPAMTGLALLSFLGHCETTDSAKYGDTVSKAISFLVDLGINNDGKLTENAANKHWCYEHAIASYALGEATSLNKQARHKVPGLRKVTQQAGQWIVDHQTPQGGWGYGYGNGGDLSIIGWQLQALKAIDHSGIHLRGLKSCITKALDHIEEYQTPDGGFNYSRNGGNPSNRGYRNLTGVGVLCLQIWGRGNSKAARQGIDYIAKHSTFDYPHKQASDIYGHYYDIQAMINHGGREWQQYNRMIRDNLLRAQDRDGSWPKPGSRIQSDSVVYRTSLCTLMLETYYRYLPAAGGH